MEIKEIVDALLIGDGTIERYKNISGRIQIRHKIKHKEYCDWIIEKTSEHLKWIDKREINSRSFIEGRLITGKQISIRTSRSKDLYIHTERWYHNNKKTIPSDFILTDFILAVWLMDDGSLGISKNGKTYIQKNMILNTQGFQKKDVLRLSEMIKEKDIKCSIQKTSRNKKQSVIVIAGEKQCRKLVDIVKKYISQVSCMGYKIDLSRTGRV